MPLGPRILEAHQIRGCPNLVEHACFRCNREIIIPQAQLAGFCRTCTATAPAVRLELRILPPHITIHDLNTGDDYLTSGGERIILLDPTPGWILEAGALHQAGPTRSDEYAAAYENAFGVWTLTTLPAHALRYRFAEFFDLWTAQTPQREQYERERAQAARALLTAQELANPFHGFPTGGAA